MLTYKLLKVRNGKLYPLFVETGRELPMNVWLDAHVGELADGTHVKSRLGPLALRPGFHSTEVPFADWIGKRQEGKLVQRKDTVWCECEVDGEEVEAEGRYGLRMIPAGWYRYCTKAKQPFPWIISRRLYIRRVLGRKEVEELCRKHGVTAQDMEV